jgi:hypothetical protein
MNGAALVAAGTDYAVGQAPATDHDFANGVAEAQQTCCADASKIINSSQKQGFLAIAPCCCLDAKIVVWLTQAG